MGVRKTFQDHALFAPGNRTFTTKKGFIGIKIKDPSLDNFSTELDEMEIDLGKKWLAEKR